MSAFRQVGEVGGGGGKTWYFFRSAAPKPIFFSACEGLLVTRVQRVQKVVEKVFHRISLGRPNGETHFLVRKLRQFVSYFGLLLFTSKFGVLTTSALPQRLFVVEDGLVDTARPGGGGKWSGTVCLRNAILGRQKKEQLQNLTVELQEIRPGTTDPHPSAATRWNTPACPPSSFSPTSPLRLLSQSDSSTSSSALAS
mmetsp:Transcript_22499/g.90223  ORF Transcript_22499/g.90223 Transcript_22499/m.90223 type:complete len:197 (-) Transcript_22499:254-844(-)